RGGGGRRGADRLQRTGHLVRVSPDGTHRLRPIDHILVLNAAQGGGTAVAVDLGGGGGEGQLALPVAGGHHRALHGGVDEGHPVQLTGGIHQVQGGLQ